jgi:hypothetical protein
MVFLAATWLVAAPTVAAQGDCVVSVEPTSGTVGTEFVVTGSGFGEPTIVTVFRNGTQVSETEVQLDADTGSFTFEVTADAAGTWLVRAILPESECGDEVEFAALANTSTEPGAGPAYSSRGILALLLAAAVLGLLLRLARPARER